MLALLDLFLEQCQVFLQGRVLRALLAQLVEQHAHGRQRRTQFVRGTGRLGGHREQLLVAHAFLAPLGLHVRLPAQGLGHLHHEESDEGRRQGEVQPHAEQVQVDQHRLVLNRLQVQRVVPDQQQGVAGQGQAGEHHGVDPGQGRSGDGQRYQVIGNEGVGRAARVIQQGAVDDQVAGQLYRVLLVGHRPRRAQAQRGEQDQAGGQAKGQAERQPRQWQQVGEPGETHRAGLRGQHENTDEEQTAKVLATGGEQENRCAHVFFRNKREYSQDAVGNSAAK